MLKLKKYDKILIIKLSALGDIINTLPVISVIKENIPYAQIGWVVEDRFADILSKFSQIDKIYVFKRKRWRNWLKSPKMFIQTIKEAYNFIRELRGDKYQVAIDLQGNLKSGLHTLASGAETRVGFDRESSKELNHIFTNRHIGFKTKKINKLKRNLVVLRKLGFKTFLSPPEIDIPQDQQIRIMNFLRDEIKGKKFVIFHPGTSAFGEYKRWPVEHFIQLGNQIKEKYDCEIVITWAKDELELAREIHDGMEQKSIICAKTDTIKMLAGIIKYSSLFIGGDTGPLHLANIIGIPVIALFGPKDPEVYGPFSKKSTTICKNLSCNPCVKRDCDHPDCMKLIEPNEVMETFEKAIEKNNIKIKQFEEVK